MTRKKTITLLGSTTVGLLIILATAGLTGNANKAGATLFSLGHRLHPRADEAKALAAHVAAEVRHRGAAPTSLSRSEE